jgi:hypothetical protein
LSAPVLIQNFLCRKIIETASNKIPLAIKNRWRNGKKLPIKALVDYTKWLMRYTGLLFAATLGMGIATIGLYASGQDQIRLARAEFLSTHRPRLRLKAMWLTSPDGEISAPALQVRSPLTVRLDIANWGNTTAYIHRINLLSLIIPFGQQLPQRPPYNESNDQGFEIFNVAVISGQTFTRAFSDGYRLSPQDLRTIQGGERRLYFVGGTIDYRDGNGLPRQTGFCRYLHFLNLPPTAGDHGRFRAIDDPDPHYEYQD